MEPSHARKHRKQEIGIIVAKILSEAYPKNISIPIDIDLLAERNEFVDNIIPAELLQDKYKVAAILARKSNEHFDILVDEDTFTYNVGRASFSIAHEFGHIVLHRDLWCDCENTPDVIALNKRIQKVYNTIEREANYFAGAILIPLRTVQTHAAHLYDGLSQEYGYDSNLIPHKVCANLAKVYKVSFHAMEIRLNQLKLDAKILSALRLQSPYLTYDI